MYTHASQCHVPSLTSRVCVRLGVVMCLCMHEQQPSATSLLFSFRRACSATPVWSMALSQQQLNAAVQSNAWPLLSVQSPHFPQLQGESKKTLVMRFDHQGWPSSGTYADADENFQMQYMNDSARWVLSCKTNGGRCPNPVYFFVLESPVACKLVLQTRGHRI